MSEAEKRIRGAMTLREAKSGWATVQVPDLAALLAKIDRLTRERNEARAEREAVAKQGETFRCLVDACKLLSSEAEEYEFDDGMGRGAMLDYWYEFDRKLDAALAQIEQEQTK